MTAAARPVLVVEDDLRIVRLLLDYLGNAGFDAASVRDGRQALEAIARTPPCLVVLDLSLPGLDGIGVCRAIRAFSDVPVLMLTARIDETDRLLGFEAGADDYLCKPFSPREMIARVQALLRRSERSATEPPPPWQVDDEAYRIVWRGRPLPLTPVEFRVLRLLLGRPGRVFSRDQLLDCAHDRERDVSDRVVDSHIKNLRRKIQAVEPGFDRLVSIYGVGYRLDLPRTASAP